MQVIHLPPQPAPKQLTVHRFSPNLEEHLMAFMCHNNQNGFLGEEETVKGYTKFEQVSRDATLSIESITVLDKPTIANIMLRLATLDKISITDLKNWAFEIKDMSTLRTYDENGKLVAQQRVLRMNPAYNLLARLLGYRNWTVLMYHARWQNGINHDLTSLEIKKKYDLKKVMIENRRDKSMIKLKLFE